MTDSVNEPGHIVACIDAAPPSESVTDYAAWIAVRTNRSIKLLHAIDHQSVNKAQDLSGSIGVGSTEELLKQMVEIEHEENRLLQKKGALILETAKRRAERAGAKEVVTCLRNGKLIENLLGLIPKTDAVVIGRYGINHRNSHQNAVGHKVEAVIRALERPILVVSQPFVEPKSALFAFDGSPASERALKFVLETKAFRGIEIYLVHVGEMSEAIKSKFDSAKQSLTASQFTVESTVLAGETDEALIAYLAEKDISLTVMGAFGHHWLKKLLVGSFTLRMLRASERPLLLVR